MKILWLILFSGSCMAQTMVITSVTGQVKDASGNLYANCQWSVVFVGQNTNPGIVYAPQAVLNGQQGTCDSSGNLTVSLADNIQTITPTPSQWSFSICSASGYVGGPYCKSNILITITGNSQNITSTLTPVMPLLPQLGLNLSAPPAIGNVTPNTGNFCNLNSTAVVGGLCTGFWGGGDIGAQVNAAYVGLSTRGGVIRIPAGSYTFSTPIVINSSNKCPIIQGDSNGTLLTFSPTSGIAITYDCNNSTHKPGGIRDIVLVGSGGTSQGIVVGSANNVDQALIFGNSISGFNNCISVNNSFNVTLMSNVIGPTCTAGILFPVNSEQNRLYNNVVFQNTTGLSSPSTAEVESYGNSYDDNSTVAISSTGSGQISSFGDHFENVAGGTSQYVTATAGVVKIFGGEMQDDGGGSNNQFITFGGTYLLVDGTLVQSGRAGAMNQLVNMTNGHAWLRFINYTNGAKLPNDYNFSYTAGTVVDEAFRGDLAMRYNVSPNAGITLLNQQPAASAITGTASDATLYTFTLPANTLAFAKGMRIKVKYLHNSGTASATIKLSIGGNLIDSIGGYQPQNNTSREGITWELFNNGGSQTAQQWSREGYLNISTVSGNLQSSFGSGTSSINFGNSQAVTVTFNVANTDQFTPVSFLMELIQ